MNDESAPRGAHEVPTKGPLNMITVPRSMRPARRTARFDSRRVRARRRIVRELDEFLGIFHYGDPALIYAIAPSREAVPNE